MCDEKNFTIVDCVRRLVLRRLVVAALAALLLSGCWPARFTYQPGITGTVISAEDGKPVVGASIGLMLPRQDLVPASAITTSSEGKFAVELRYEWGLAFILGEYGPALGAVEITAVGFAPYLQALKWDRPHTFDLGVIQLVPLR